MLFVRTITQYPVAGSLRTTLAAQEAGMNLRIVDQDGTVWGSLETVPATMWKDVLLYVSKTWETQAHKETGEALVAVLAGGH